MTDQKPTTAVQFTIRGKVKWAKVFENNRDLKGPNGNWERDGGRYTITVVVDDKSEKTLKEVGSQKKVKVDSEGDRVVQLERKHIAPYSYGGPPRVIHADKTPWSFMDDGLIGNGSEAIIAGTVYEAGGLKGTRLEVVQVLDHVVYEVDNPDYDPLDKFGIVSQADDADEEKPKAKKATKKKTSEEVPDDEIPF